MARFSDQQKSLMWERWRQGDTLREVARQLERPPCFDFQEPSGTGGGQPPARSRSTRAMRRSENATQKNGTG